jgi:2-keto-4-pentenoate hydratase
MQERRQVQEPETHRAAARLLARAWMAGRHLGELPSTCQPATRADGYAVQALWPQVTGQQVAGWKIAATSKAGQRHIAVAGPLAGPVFAHRVLADGAVVPLAANRMRVAECEIVFRIGGTLAPRAHHYGRDEVLAAVAALHPGIEVPDSRLLHFERAGEAQLIADCACTNDMVVGAAAPADERLHALPQLLVQAEVSDGRRPQGVGSNVLGDPVEALVWLVNEITAAGQTVEAGQFVTTGACVPPIPVEPGLRAQADFGWIGRISVSFA